MALVMDQMATRRLWYYHNFLVVIWAMTSAINRMSWRLSPPFHHRRDSRVLKTLASRPRSQRAPILERGRCRRRVYQQHRQLLGLH